MRPALVLPNESFALPVCSPIRDPKPDDASLFIPASLLFPHIVEWIEHSGRFVDRDANGVKDAGCESDESVKQIIPYVTLVNGNKQVLRYQRCKTNGEKRLLGMHSLGFGGHIEPADGVPLSWEFIQTEACREVLEETNLKIIYSGCEIPLPDLPKHLIFNGGIFTPGDAVGRVHFGLHFCLFVGENYSVTAADNCENLEWLRLPALRESQDGLEAWSKVVLHSCLSGLTDAT